MAETPRATQAADRMQSSVATLKNGLSSSPARQEQDDDGERLRGVVALPRQREYETVSPGERLKQGDFIFDFPLAATSRMDTHET